MTEPALDSDPAPGRLVRTAHIWRPSRALVLASRLMFKNAQSWLCLVLKAGQTQPEIISKLWIDVGGASREATHPSHAEG